MGTLVLLMMGAPLQSRDVVGSKTPHQYKMENNIESNYWRNKPELESLFTAQRRLAEILPPEKEIAVVICNNFPTPKSEPSPQGNH